MRPAAVGWSGRIVRSSAYWVGLTSPGRRSSGGGGSGIGAATGGSDGGGDADGTGLEGSGVEQATSATTAMTATSRAARIGLCRTIRDPTVFYRCNLCIIKYFK